MAPDQASTGTRWAGVPVARRKDERRDMLIEAAFALFGADGESALSVRAVCREAGLHTRYFYENFADTSELLADLYDRQAAELGEALFQALDEAGPDPERRTRAGIRSVLRHISDDPRRGSVLFAEVAGNEVLAARRKAAETAMLEGIIAMASLKEPPLPLVVAATMFTGAMNELARQWCDGRLGTDLDAVVDAAVAYSLSLLATANRLRPQAR
ncbi:TetR/AcrR family transcriptional regulator [Spirillospora sp. NPDC047279]|uniref:TetR/AcrR family transcriptional regulator n=1 Tax=Spirillospora sp. NPDC047279 TaxID=3155478 RepID=UPI0033E09590